MTEPDLDPIFRSDTPYKYKFTLTKHEDGDIYKGFAPTIVPRQNPNDDHDANVNRLQYPNEYGSRKIHVIHLQSDIQVSDYCLFAKTSNQTFKPALNLKPKDEILRNTTIVVGGYIGVPLLQWISDKSRNGWEYDVDGNYLRFGSNWRDVGRWLGGALYKEHCAHRFVGNLLHSTFVNEAAQKVVFVKNPVMQASLIAVMGIQDDLQEMNNLVVWLEKSFPIKNLTTTAHDLAVFHNFYPGNNNLSANIEDLKVLSYFMCHNFLYFDVDQRFAFSAAYRRIKQTSSDFITVNLSTPINFIEDTWNHSLPANGAFEAVYYNQLGAHINKHGLVHFHRSCEEHYNDEADEKNLPILSKTQIDYHLLVMFRQAIPELLTLCSNLQFRGKV